MTIQALAEIAAARPLTQEQLNELAELWQSTMLERLDLDRKSKKLKDQETIAQTVLIQQMRINKLTAFTAAQAVTVSQAPEYVPHVMDWDAYWGFIKSTNDFSLLEKRPGKSACQERWDAGEDIPGVEKYPVYKLSVHKL